MLQWKVNTKHPLLILFYNVIIWIGLGTIVYGGFGNFGFYQGLFNSVNIGFGFGWCFPFRPGANFDYVVWFSAFYMLASVLLFQQVIYTIVWLIQLNSSIKWYEFESTIFRRSNVFDRAWKYVNNNRLLMGTIIAAVVLVITGCCLGSTEMEWTSPELGYYVVSTLTGVGAASIAVYNSNHNLVVTVSVYSAIAVVVGNVLLALIVRCWRLSGTLVCTTRPVWINSQGKLDAQFLFPLRPNSSGAIHTEELELLSSAGIRIHPESPHLTRHEFFVLSMLRLGKITYAEAKSVYKCFDEMDCVHGGRALIRDICSSRTDSVVVHAV